MKILILFFMLILPSFLFGSSLIDDAFAICMSNMDWPDAPCYGCPSCYPGIEQAKKDWEGYYEFKGEKWMEQKKIEMLKVIKENGLKQWLNNKSSHNDDSNQNIWNYYYLKGEVPREHGKYVDEFDPPRYQFSERNPQSHIGVLCNHAMELLVKENKKTPACLNKDSAAKLVQRGWGYPVQTKNIDDEIWHGNIRFDIIGGELKHVASSTAIRDNIRHQETISLTFEIVPSTNGTLAVSIPYGIMNTSPNHWMNFDVTVDKNPIESVYHIKPNYFQMHMIPFESDTKEITVSIPPWPLWIKVEKMDFVYADWVLPPIDFTEEKIKNFPNLYSSITVAKESIDDVKYRTVSSDETEKLKELLGVAYKGQKYLMYDGDLFTIDWAFQYDRP